MLDYDGQIRHAHAHTLASLGHGKLCYEMQIGKCYGSKKALIYLHEVKMVWKLEAFKSGCFLILA